METLSYGGEIYHMPGRSQPYELADLARIIHERFYYNRGFAAATGLDAAGAASRQAGSPLGRSVNILFKDASLPPGSARLSRPPSLTLPHSMGEGEGGGPTNRHE